MTLDELITALTRLRVDVIGSETETMLSMIGSDEELYDAPVTSVYVQAGHVFLSSDDA